MLQKFEINGVHAVVDDSLRKYITRKIGNLDKYIPRHSRASVHAEAFVKETKAKNKQHATFEVTMYLPQETINIKESTLNMFAAVDIVEAKLKMQLKKYKELHQGAKLHRRLFGRFSRHQAATVVQPEA